ncbi:MAG: TPM domain-containing protein [Pseudomonadales bacterium]|nr:TPM domain-containing protein [Pseudomonadales bacterium]
MALLTEAETRQVSDAIARVEKTTDAELVTVLARQADEYHYIPSLWAALIALISPGIILFTPFWLDVVEIVMIQLAVFLVMAVTLRIPPVLRRIIPKGVKQWRAANLARRQFLENNLHHTEGETGLLIFVSETERYVEIIADRGISQHVPDTEWQAIVDAFTRRVHAGKTLEGFLYAVEACGSLLAQHVPATHERNELPDHMILID